MSRRTLLGVGSAIALALLANHARDADAKAAETAGWTTAYRPGAVDAKGRRLGGTEVRALVPFAGKLYAGLGYWMDSDKGDPGAQVLALGGADEPWRVDLQLDEVLPSGPRAGTRRYSTIGALDALTLTTDGTGARLPAPVRLLAAGPWSRAPRTDVFVRGERSGWERTTLGLARGNVRSLTQHVDRQTGVSRAFAGAAPLGIFSATYDPAAQRLVWSTAPEAWFTSGDRDDAPAEDWRVMSFTEWRGLLFATVGPCVYVRQDGPSPAWEQVYRATFPPDINMKGNGGLRGLTTIKNPAGPGEVLLVTAGGPTARVLRIDPAHAFAELVDQDVVALLSSAWHAPVGGALLAYNEMTPVSDPRTGEPVLLLGLQAWMGPQVSTPSPTWWRYHASATYLVRHADGRYEVRAMEDPTVAPLPRVAVRTMAIAPFAPGVLYAGGFDANAHPVHDTAWAFRAPLATVLGPASSAAP